MINQNWIKKLKDNEFSGGYDDEIYKNTFFCYEINQNRA